MSEPADDPPVEAERLLHLLEQTLPGEFYPDRGLFERVTRLVDAWTDLHRERALLLERIATLQAARGTRDEERTVHDGSPDRDTDPHDL